MSATSTPALIVSDALGDALASITKATSLAFSSVQDQARVQVAQASADSREARRERDDAVKALHSSRAQQQAQLEQAELTIKHQTETIAQLKHEASQWKEQCLRLEETSRQEALSWKEQFLRVEQERCRLSGKLDELLAQQTAFNSQNNHTVPPYTPNLKLSDASGTSISSRSHFLPPYTSASPTVQMAPLVVSAKTQTISRHATSTRTRDKPNRKSPVVQLPTPSNENRSHRPQGNKENTSDVNNIIQDGSRPVFVRRVNAVIEVPVKQESADGEIFAGSVSSASTSASSSFSAVDIRAVARRPQRIEKNKRLYVEVDDEDDESYQGSGHSDEAGSAEENSDDDDELMMGAEDNAKEVYGIRRVSIAAHQGAARPRAESAKKRKVGESASSRRPTGEKLKSKRI